MDSEISNKNKSLNDPIYQQCYDARLSTFTDKFASVSSVTFGSNLSSPSAPVGSMLNHAGQLSTGHEF